MKTLFWVLGIIVIIAILGGVYFAKSSSDTTQDADDANGGLIVTDNDLPPMPPSDDSQTDSSVTETQVIEIEASRFQYSPSTITVKKGQPVKLMITNTETTHGIYIPDLNVRGIGEVEFTPTVAGTYEFRCPTVCGSGHANMKGTLIVTE